VRLFPTPRPRPGPARVRASRLAMVAGALVTASACLAGCASSSGSSSAPAASSSTPASSPSARSPAAAAAAYPVTVTSCGNPVTYDSAPTRAVSNDINATEDMLALGLESHMVGTFGVLGDGPVGQPVPAEYLAGFHEVRDVSSDYFTLEELVGLNPDFLFAGWNYGLQTGTDLTPQGLSKFGIKTLALTESCAWTGNGTRSVSINDTYTDLRNLGEIFNVRAKASRVIASMQAQVASAQAKIAGLKPIKVFDYDSGEAAPFTGPGLAMPTALIALGGGTNIFAGLKQSWTSVSWEQVVKDDPGCIIINDYGTPTAAQKEKFLETSPITENLTAVKNRCFLPLAYDEVTPSPRNAQAVVAIARWLHPAAVGLPADGS
jgi:iron complex transport system substrate-binding protein